MSSGAIGFASSTFEGHNGTGSLPMPSRLASKEEMKRLVKAMAFQGRGIFMLTKSNNTDIDDIENIMKGIARPAMIAAILYNLVKKDWAINTLNDISVSIKKGMSSGDRFPVDLLPWNFWGIIC